MYLSKFALRLLAQLLRMAAEEFSNHGCNDFEIEDTPEARQFMTGVEVWNSPEEFEEYGISIFGDKIVTQDSTLMSYFADWAKKTAEEKSIEWEDNPEPVKFSESEPE